MKPKIFYLISTFVIFITIIGFIWLHAFTIPRLVALTQVDPLFYLPQNDATALAHEINLLSIEESNTIASIKNHPQYESVKNASGLNALLENGFLPLSYLKLLPDNTIKNERFVDQPTFLNALTLLTTYWKTAQAYKQEAYLFDKNLSAILATREKPFQVRGIGSEINSNTIESDIMKIKQNSYALTTDVKKRIACLFAGAYCKPKIYSLPQIEDLLERDPHTPPLPKSALPKKENILDRVGPYTVSSTCFPFKTNEFYLYLNGPYGFLPKQINENYYLSIDVIEESRPAYAQIYLTSGIQYLLQPEGASYRCSDLRYWGDLATIAYFDTALPKENIKSIADIVVQYETLDLDQKKVFENRLPFLPDMLHNVTSFLKIFERDVKYFSISPLYILGIRSSYALTYQTFSRSVWRIDSSLEYVSSSNLSPPPGISTYYDLNKANVDISLDSLE